MIQPSAISSNVTDVFPVSGKALIPAGVITGNIELSVMADNVPELHETFSVVLVRTEGGADIDRVFNISIFSIRYDAVIFFHADMLK